MTDWKAWKSKQNFIFQTILFSNRFHLYADYLSKCSTVDQQFMGNAEEHEEQAEQNARGKLAAKFAMDLGLDEMVRILH